jgi:uncharacterized membrane protein YfcA
VHSLSLLDIIAITAAGFGAGTVNSIVGSGSLITFPTLVALGVPPLVANVSNTVGIVFGNASSVHGYRRELMGQAERMRALVPLSAAGGLLGSVLLLVRPSTFKVIVPWLILAAVVLVIIQPRVAKSLADRGERHPHGGLWLRVALFATGVYGGYFGAAQGVIMIAILAIGLDETLQRINGLKNVCAFTANLVAAIVFMFFGPVHWIFVLILALSSIVGGQFGAHVGRKIPARVLRLIIVGAGLAVAIKLLV